MHRLSTRPTESLHGSVGEVDRGARHRLGGPGPVPTTDGHGRRRRGRWLVVVARPTVGSELVGTLCTLDGVTPGRFHVLVAPTPDIVGATAFVLASGGCVPVDPLTLAAGGVPRSAAQASNFLRGRRASEGRRGATRGARGRDVEKADGAGARLKSPRTRGRRG